MLSQRGTEAFITSWLHFCNSLFADLPAISLRHLQLTLNFTSLLKPGFLSILLISWENFSDFILVRWQFQVEINFLLASIQRCFPLLIILFSYSFAALSLWVAFHLLLSESVSLVNLQNTAKAPHSVQASQWSALTCQFKSPKMGLCKGGLTRTGCSFPFNSSDRFFLPFPSFSFLSVMNTCTKAKHVVYLPHGW